MVNSRRLKAAIILAGYTQAELAEAASMSKNALNAKINGRSDFRLDEIDTLCRLLTIEKDEDKAQIFLSQISQ